MSSIDGPVWILVYMDVASHVKSLAPVGTVMLSRRSFRAKESLKRIVVFVRLVEASQ
jgi:hypothetical protein